MKQQKQLIFLIVVVLIIVAVWVLFFREPQITTPSTSPATQPTVVTPEKTAPKLNNTLETTVTVVEPSDSTN